MSEFEQFIVDQLQELGIIDSKRMFGGYGLYLEDIFFAIIHEDRLYFKVDKESKQKYVDAGMHPFQPSQKQTLKSYYEVPASVIEDEELLLEWASRAIQAQLEK
jgi:DNA transformation protein